MKEREPQPVDDGPEATGRLLSLLRELAVEARPERADDLRVGLESDLERDLGLDSLAKSELLLRVEKEFALAESPTLKIGFQAHGSSQSSNPNFRQRALISLPGPIPPLLGAASTSNLNT